MFSDVLYSIMERPNGALLWSVPMAHQHLLLYAAGNNNESGGCRE